jgi:hypothetical protein
MHMACVSGLCEKVGPNMYGWVVSASLREAMGVTICRYEPHYHIACFVLPSLFEASYMTHKPTYWIIRTVLLYIVENWSC